MEVIKPGSAAHLKAAVAPQLPQVDLSASWPRAGPGLPIRRDQQLPYMLHPGQQQPPQRPPEVATPPQPPQRPPEVATPPQPPQRPPEVATPQRQPSQHSLNLRSASVESGGSGGGGVTAEPYMQPGVLVMSVPAMPTVVPPLTPSRSSSGHMQRAHTFPDVDTVPDADTFPDVNTFPDSDTDKNGYMKIAPTSVPPPPMARRMTQPVFSNPEESVLPVPPTTSAQVGTVVDMMKNMSVEQVQMLVQMLSKLAPGGSQNGGNAPVHPPQLCKMQGTRQIVHTHTCTHTTHAHTKHVHTHMHTHLHTTHAHTHAHTTCAHTHTCMQAYMHTHLHTHTHAHTRTTAHTEHINTCYGKSFAFGTKLCHSVKREGYCSRLSCCI